jgi:hypothetical protein
VQIDSLIIQPGSLQFLHSEPDSCFIVDYAKSILYKNCPLDSLEISYSVLPWKVDENYGQQQTIPFVPENYYLIENSYQSKNESVEPDSSNYSINGDFSRALVVSSNGELSMNNSIDLTISGQLNSETSNSAVIRDKQIPIQPEGTTATLEELDQVYVELNNQKFKMQGGDYSFGHQAGLLNFTKKAKSIGAEITMDNYRQETQISFQKGIFRRQILMAETGKQGPYLLQGNQNETPITVLANSERVYINGILQKRGEDKDYTVDYNNGEILFTSTQLISSDLRISVEFEYKSPQANSSIFHSSEFSFSKLNFGIDYYAQQQSKSDFIQNTPDSLLLQQIFNGGFSGSSFEVPSFNLAEYSSSKALYILKDTLVADSVIQNIFHFSTDSTKTLYNVNFTYVGSGNGNYQQTHSQVNFIIYTWVANKQGDYEAIQKIEIPDKKQYLQFRTSAKLDSTKAISAALLFSWDDKNRISPYNAIQKANALQLQYSDSLSFKKQTKGILSFDFYSQSKDFSAVEPLFDAEFLRNWNLNDTFLVQEFQKTQMNLNILKTSNARAGLSLSAISQKTGIKAVQTSWTVNKRINLFETNGNGFYTQNFNVKGLNYFAKHNQSFYYHLDSSQIYSLFDAELHQNSDRNANSEFLTVKTGFQKSDSLNKGFHSYFQFRYKNHFSSPNSLSVLYIEKTSTKQNHQTKTAFSAQSENDSLGMNSKFVSILIDDIRTIPKCYINLQLHAENFASKEPERIEQFVKVANGQGYFKWIDYNHNNVEELGEFEKSPQLADANYLRFYTPTNKETSYLNQNYKIMLLFDGSPIEKTAFGATQLLKAFRMNLFIENKNKTDYSQFKVFLANKSDSVTVISINNKRVMFSYQMKKMTLSTHFSELQNYSIYINGGETQKQKARELRAIYRYNNMLSTQIAYISKLNTNINRYYLDRNYNYISSLYEISTTVESNDKHSISILLSNNELVTQTKMKLGSIQTASLLYSFNWTNLSLFVNSKLLNIKYLDEIASPMAFEILQQHQQGKNMDIEATLSWQLGRKWTLSSVYQAQISNVYVVHTGQIEIKAKF